VNSKKSGRSENDLLKEHDMAHGQGQTDATRSDS
jgi:hypothetical protein